MLSKGVRNLISLQKTFLQSKNLIGLTARPKYNFFKNNQDDEDSKAPEGFEKFKRRTKKKTE